MSYNSHDVRICVCFWSNSQVMLLNETIKYSSSNSNTLQMKRLVDNSMQFVWIHENERLDRAWPTLRLFIRKTRIRIFVLLLCSSAACLHWFRQSVMNATTFFSHLFMCIAFSIHPFYPLSFVCQNRTACQLFS